MSGSGSPQRTMIRVGRALGSRPEQLSPMSPRSPGASSNWWGDHVGELPPIVPSTEMQRQKGTFTGSPRDPYRIIRLEDRIKNLIQRNNELELQLLALKAGALDAASLADTEPAPAAQSESNANNTLPGSSSPSSEVKVLRRKVELQNKQILSLTTKNNQLTNENESLKGSLESAQQELRRAKKNSSATDDRASGELERERSEVARLKEEVKKLKEDLVAAQQPQSKPKGSPMKGKGKDKDLKDKMENSMAMFKDQVGQLGLITQLLKEELTKIEFLEGLSRVPVDVKDDWIFQESVHLKRLGKLLSLNAVTSKGQGMSSMATQMAKITQEACELLHAERATVFAIDYKRGELYSMVSGGKGSPPFEIRIPDNVGIAGHVFQTGEVLSIPDAYEDYRFNQEVDRKSGLRTKAILCAPISAHAGYKMGVIQVMNRKDGDYFDEDHAKLLEGLAIRTGIFLLQSQTYEDVVNAQVQFPLLELIMNSFAEEIRIDRTMDVIVKQVMEKLNAVRCTVWLADTDAQELFTRSANTNIEIRIPWDTGIAGMCFQGGQTINIPVAYEDPRFNKEVDLKTGFKTRNVLAMPIVADNGGTIGVIQAINKGEDDDPDMFFDEDDEYYMKKLAAQASFNLNYARLYENALQRPPPSKKQG
eukprot:comp22046_c0_seq1/m.50888 comp22046_c0_seq1/g.50888  ORF comp22046_c0_seq1/g.50888 comp22046_c0_seq1/m.50888 type:complete len:649 (-) comp22046_c0_seq1:73-2019(-)